MSSTDKPPADTDEPNRTKSDNLNTTTKSSPHISSHHNDKTKPDTKKLVNRASRFSQSDGSIIKPEENACLKKKINKVWSRGANKEKNLADAPEKDAVEAGLIAEMDGLNFNNDAAEDTWVHSELVHARDSLENLNSSPRTNRATTGDLGNSKSTCFSQEKHTLTDNPIAVSSSEASSSTMRVLTWDPWDRMGRKPKKENKRRKMAEKFQPPKVIPTEEPPPPLEKDEMIDDEPESYQYQPYKHPPSKSVEFTGEVMVVYFNGDDVVGESKEPLKKELEQQLRNKEMRKGHMPAMLGTKRKFPDDFKGAWF